MVQPPLDPREVLGLSPQELPRHIAIIMDGTGRWAARRDAPRIMGHERGAKSVKGIVTHCARLGIDVLSLYCFSTENWKRPRDEVDFLMGLYVQYLIAERETIMDNNVRFRHLGRADGLPESVMAEMEETIAMSRDNTGLTLCLALNYGYRNEMIDAIRGIALAAKEGRLDPGEIDEALFSRSLYTAGLPDPDLLIRTANERRLSNFMLWQISYAEIHVSQELWPDFGVEDLNTAIKDFAGRPRRFGDVNTPTPQPAP